MCSDNINFKKYFSLRTVAGQVHCRNQGFPFITAKNVMNVVRVGRKNNAAQYRAKKKLKAPRGEEDEEDTVLARSTKELLVQYMTRLGAAVEKFKMPNQ
jgi:hypothetical protein